MELQTWSNDNFTDNGEENTMIKVVHFIHGLNMGGAETLVKDYALLLDKSKFNVTVLCYTRCDSPYEAILRQNNIPVVYLCDEMPFYGKTGAIAKLVNRFQRYWLVRRELQQLNPDIVHFHLSLSDYVRFSGLKKSVKLFYTQHFDTTDWEADNPMAVKNLRWLLTHHGVQLIALNGTMKIAMNKIFKTDATKILNNGVDLSAFRQPIDRNRKRMNLGIPQNAFVIVHVGRFDPVKNHVFLVDIFKEIKKELPEAFLLMVGKGKTEQRVEEKIKAEGLEGSYKILHDRTDVPEILLASDAALFPSVSEGLGIAVIEMQAAGLPCVASTGVPENACISNKLQFLSLELSAREWARKLLEMCEDTAPIQYSGIEEWDIRHNVKQLEKMYEGED